MRLDQYQWSHNPRGIHNTRAFLKLNHERYVQTRMGWIKLVCGGDDYVKDIPLLNGNGVTPIIRIYKAKFGASQVTADQLSLIPLYIGAGARWFEFYNEPNLRLEWPDTIQPDYNNLNDVIAPLMEHWLQWAELVINFGGYPAFPALSETVGNYEDVTSWITVLMNYLAQNAYDRFRTIANNGLWCATHPYFYNHFYQEAGKANRARQPSEQNGTEGGWHFEYPYDPITQADDPGRSVLGASPGAPSGDPIGLIGMGMAFMQKFQELFGGIAIPVVGTEGGITPVPKRNSLNQIDTRFPGYDWNSHAEATVACFNWIANQAPPWMFGLTLWKEDDYWADDTSTDSPERLVAVRRLAEVPPPYKNVGPVEALGGPGPGPLTKVLIPGPAAIHGAPDLHFLFIASEFDPAWFFDAASEYWERFRPTVLASLDLIGELPNTKSLAVTLLTRPAQSASLTNAIKARGANIYVDLITADSAETVGNALRARVSSNRRFG